MRQRMMAQKKNHDSAASDDDDGDDDNDDFGFRSEQIWSYKRAEFDLHARHRPQTPVP